MIWLFTYRATFWTVTWSLEVSMATLRVSKLDGVSNSKFREWTRRRDPWFKIRDCETKSGEKQPEDLQVLISTTEVCFI